MRKKLLFSFLAVMIAAAGLAAGQQAAGPKIAAPEALYNAGKVMQGTEISHVFSVRNTGTQTLVIERVQPT